jgi:undecaprenyl-diphosphatase
MKKKDMIWPALLGLAAMLTLALKYLPFLPGDVSCTRLVQSLLPESKEWAKRLSSTAEMPWVLILISITFLISLAIARWRAALLSVVSFMGLWLLGKGLGPIIAQPRPSHELVHVERLLSGSAFPSIFALNYISTVGFLAVLATVKTSGKLRWAILLVCSLILIVGWVARVALAAHWPSDVAISYLIGLLWVTLLIRFA